MALNSGCLSGNGDNPVDSAFQGDPNDDSINLGKDAFDSKPSSYDFGAIAVSDSSGIIEFNLINTHNRPVYISKISSSNENFIMVSHNCPLDFNPILNGSSCKVTSKFSPQTSGSLSAVIRIEYGTTAGNNTSLSDTIVLAGAGVANLSFSGLETISPVTHNTMQLNWTANAGATAFQIFEIVSGTMVYRSTVLNIGGSVAASTVTGLQPSTTYTFRVRGFDILGNSEGNTNDVTLSTIANSAPSLAAIANPSTFGGTPLVDIDANDSTTANDTDSDGDPITYTCRYDNSIDGSVGIGLGVCSALPNEGGGNPTFSSSSGILSGWIPLFTSTGSSYEFEIIGTDPYGAISSVIFSTTIQAGVPLLSNPSDLIFPGGHVIQGSLVSVDFDNIRSGSPSDTGITYTCVFDRVVDGTVSSGSNCTNLQGSAPTFPNNDGIISWTPDETAWGPYELLITGTNTAGSDTEHIVINISPPFVTSNLQYFFNAQFADATATQGTNSPFTSSWTDIFGPLGSITGILSNFSAISTSGWRGALPNLSATAHLNPYQLVFDGTNDNVGFGAIINSNTDLLLDLWLRPSNVSTGNRIIIANGDSSDRGFSLRLDPEKDGRIFLNVGDKSYAQEVLADNPVLYFRINENGGPTALNAGSAALTGTYSNVAFQGESALVGEVNGSGSFNGSNSKIDVGSPSALQITGDQTIEFWVKPANFSARRNPIAKAYGGEGTITQEPNATFNYYYGTNGGNGGSYQGFGSGTALTLNVWTHVVLVRDLSGTGKLRWYYNGSEVANTNANYGAATAGSLPFLIGAGYVSNYAGNIDEVAVYNTALSPARIAAHYSARSVPACRSKTAMVDDKWYHVGAILDDSADTLSLFVNGNSECTIANTAVFAGSTNNLVAGLNASGDPSSAWNGSLAEARLYNSTAQSTITSNFGTTNNQYYGERSSAPNQISDLYFWVKADTIVGGNGDLVSLWPDQGSSGTNLTQSISANKPTLIKNGLNGYPVVNFDGSDDFLETSLVALPAPFTILVVAKFNNTNQPGGNYDYIYSLGANGGAANSLTSLSRYASGADADKYYSYNNAIALAGDVLLGNQYTFLRQVFRPSAPFHQSWQNSISLNPLDYPAAANTSGALNLGRWINNAHFLDGGIAEFMIYNRELTSSEIQRVESYLKNKYGL